MAFDVLVVNPNPLLNLVYAGHFTPGALNRVQSIAVAAEGKGVNVARCLARLGYAVVLTGFAGGYSGAWLRDLVRKEGIQDACIGTAAPMRLGFMASSPDAEHPTTVLENGFPVRQAELRALSERLDSLLPSVRLVIASGSVPDPVAEDVYRDLLVKSSQRSVPCWIDAYGPAMSRALEGPVAPALCKPNRQEFRQIRGWECVEELHVTDGAGRIEVSSHFEGRWSVRPPVIRQVNPVGSGDCYLAGLAHGWLSGLPFRDRLRFAAAAGAANALRPDVAMIEPREIMPLLQQVTLERW